MEECENRSSPSSSTDTLNAEFKDGQLQIVEVTPFPNEEDDEEYVETIHMEAEPSGCNYVQVYDINGEQVVQLDLMNLTLVNCEDRDDDQSTRTYELVTEEDDDKSKDYEDSDTHTYYIQANAGDTGPVDRTTSKYVMIDVDDKPLVFLESDLKKASEKRKKPNEKKPKTVAELLKKRKALDKAKLLLSRTMRRTGRGRPRTLPVPAPDEMLSSPNFRLYLYHCKLCSFKCNAAKELTQHKRTEHLGGKSKNTKLPRPPETSSGKSTNTTVMQCTKCFYNANNAVQLMRHIQELHMKKDEDDPGEGGEEEGEVLVCAACGYQTETADEFRKHAADVHAANVTLALPDGNT